MKQISFADTGFERTSKRTRKRVFLEEMEQVVAGLKNQVQRFREISPFPGPSPLQVSASPAFCAAGR